MQKLQLSIPEPCHENWHQMTPTEQGRFCNACSKEVVDFSMMNRYQSFSIRKVRFIGYFILTSILCLIGIGVFSQNNYNVKKIFAGNIPSGDSNQLKKAEIVIRLTCPRSLNTNPPNLLYVLDGNRVEPENINADSVANVTLLKDSVIVLAIFGITGKNGAMIITTKKFNLFKVKNLDTVKISSGTICRRRRICCGSVVKTDNCFQNVKDNLSNEKIKNFNLLSVFPNPVQHGNSFSISIKLKQVGIYYIQISDIAGRIVLQKQTNISAKDFIEKIQADSRWGSGFY